MRPIVPLCALMLTTVATPALAQAGPPPAPAMIADGTMLEVSAEGRVTRTPDLATVRAGVVSQATTAAAALADNASRMARVIAALKGAGIADRDLSTANVSVAPQYRYAENQPPAITGYQATNSVSVRFRDVAKSGRVLDALVKQGANQIDGPSLSLADPDAALNAAREDAVKRARARADLYARAAGLRVDRIVSITESGSDAGGSPPPVMFRAMAVPKAPATEVLPGETDVTATLSVRFLLK